MTQNRLLTPRRHDTTIKVRVAATHRHIILLSLSFTRNGRSEYLLLLRILLLGIFAVFEQARMRENVELMSLPNVPSPEMSILRLVFADSGTDQGGLDVRWTKIAGCFGRNQHF